MPALDASAPARDAIDEFLRHLAGRDLSASTRRIRKTFLNEYLRHAQQAAGAEKQLTARDLLDGERAAAWLADAAEGKTRTRNTLRGPDAAAYPNSMRVRADTVNAFAEFLGEPVRVDRQAPARGYHLTPGDTERLLHDLTVKRPIHANAMTALRTAAVAAVIADTGHGVPEIADLKLSALHLDGDEAGGQEAASNSTASRSRSPGRRCTSSPAGSPPARRSSPSSRAATPATSGSRPSPAGRGAACRRPSPASARPPSAPCTPRTGPWSASCSAPRSAPAPCAPPRSLPFPVTADQELRPPERP